MINWLWKIIKRIIECLYIRFILWMKIRHNFKNQKGLEVGGPSKIFKKLGLMPIYSVSNQVDVCNFSNQTVWEGLVEEGFNFKPEKEVIGIQLICDGSNIHLVSDQQYDFILSCHNLEHFANPLKAIKEWLRILRQNGTLMLILPDPEKTFDRLRPITELEHLKNDFNNNVGEDDSTHIDEIIKFTDFSIYPREFAVDKNAFIKLCKDNAKNRCAHQHVFDAKLLEEIFNYFNISKIMQFKASPYHLVVMGKKNY